jgi:hypothetical protein
MDKLVNNIDFDAETLRFRDHLFMSHRGVLLPANAKVWKLSTEQANVLLFPPSPPPSPPPNFFLEIDIGF